jgi:hypothetical protein
MANQIEEVLRIVAEVDSSLTSLEQIQLRIKALKEEAAKIDVKLNPQAFEDTQRKITQLEIAETKLKNSTAQMSAEMRRAEGAVKGFGDAAAVSGGVAIALGQTFSDIGQFGFGFAQGIRAIANNISQLATLFTIAVVQANSFKAAIRAIWATMMGPLGIVVALQMVIGAIDLFASSQRKAKETADSLTKSIDEQKLRFDVLKGAMNISEDANGEYIKSASKLNDEMAKSIKLTGDLSVDMENYSKFLQLTTEYTILFAKAQDLQNKITNKQISFWQDLKFTIMDFIFENGRARGEIKLQEKTQKELNDTLYELYQTELQLQALRKEEIKKTKESTKENTKKYQLKKEWLLVDKQALELMERTIKLGDKLEDAELRRSALIYNYIEGERTKAEKLFDEYQAVTQAIAMLDVSNSERQRMQLQADLEYRRRLREIELGDVNAMLDKEQKARENALNNIKAYQQAVLLLASNTAGFLIALNQAVEYQSEEGRKKAFKRDKALRVAQATIDTYAAATRALTTPLPPPIPKLIAASYIAAGLANVATILGQNYNGGTSAGGQGGMGGGGLQGGYPYPMSGFSTIAPQFPDRTGSLDIVPRTQRIYVLESDISGSQKTSIDREMKAGVF